MTSDSVMLSFGIVFVNSSESIITMARKSESKMKSNEEKDKLDINEAKSQKVSDKDSASTEEQTTMDPVQELEQKLMAQEEKFLRLYADFENFRRRSIKEHQDLVLSASKDLVSVLLPILDDFERAVANNEKLDDPSALKEGFGLIHSKFLSILSSKGLKPIEAIDSDFDYELHEAIAKIPVEDQFKKGKVIDQVEKGYYLNDKVIRYAKVVVGE